LLGPDYIDATVNDADLALNDDSLRDTSSAMLPVVAQVDPQPSISSSVVVPPTTILNDDDVDSDDLSLRGSSVMDQDNEDLTMFRHILDGYDYMSSADDEIHDTDIEDIDPVVHDNEVTLATTPSSDTDIDDAIELPQFFSDTDSIPSIDERISEPELDTQMPDELIVRESTDHFASPVTSPIVSSSFTADRDVIADEVRD
ncbi:hypothetical protein ABG067_008291, partial [Albugo candida]